LLLVNTPGSVTLYAFSMADAQHLDELGRRLDELTHGLAAQGGVGAGPIKLVAVAAFDGPLDSGTTKAVTRLMPSHYLSGIRPSTWAVDLQTNQIYSSGRLGKREGAEPIELALQSEGDGGDLYALQRKHAQSSQAFYRLMTGRQPLVTYALIAVNVLLFVLLYENGGPDNTNAIQTFGALTPRLVEQGQWWRLFTTMFEHGGVTHIFLNMISLYILGTVAERWYGSAKFLGIYLGSGICGSLAAFAYAVHTGDLNDPIVGASGAIFGIAGALITVRFQPSNAIPLSVRQQVSNQIIVLVVINLVASFLIPHIANSAHIGGLIGGALLSFFFPLTREVTEASP
jgi:rhomboid protease GluP